MKLLLDHPYIRLESYDKPPPMVRVTALEGDSIHLDVERARVLVLALIAWFVDLTLAEGAEER